MSITDVDASLAPATTLRLPGRLAATAVRSRGEVFVFGRDGRMHQARNPSTDPSLADLDRIPSGPALDLDGLPSPEVAPHGSLRDSTAPGGSGTSSVQVVHMGFVGPAALRDAVEAAPPGGTVVPVFPHRGHLCIGPLLRRGSCPCPVDVAVRVGSTSPRPEIAERFMEAADEHDGLLQSTSPTRELDPGRLDEVVYEAITVLRTLPAGTVLVLSTDDDARCATVLPLPGEPYHRSQLRQDSYLFGIASADVRDARQSAGDRQLVNEVGDLPVLDPMFGPIVSLRETRRYPGEPAAMEAWSANVAAVGHFTEWIPDQAGAGVNFSRSAARGAAVGEAAERYGGQVPTDVVYASESSLRARGLPVVGVASWELFTDEQHARPGWRFRRWSPDEELSWTRARCVATPSHSALVPTAHVLLGHGRRTLRDDPASVPPLAGIAAGRSLEDAELSGLLELVERDATMRWWHGGVPARRLAPEVTSELEIHDLLWDGVEVAVELEFLSLATEAAAHVIAALFRDRALDLVGIGFAARTDLRSAIVKAAAEAWQLRRIDVDLLDQSSPLWTQVRTGQFKMPLRPFREDRRYLEDYTEDHSCMRVLTDNLQYYLDPRALAVVDRRLAEIVAPGPDHRADRPEAGSAAVLLDSTVRAGWRVFSVDMTPTDLARRGLHVARVLSPDLCPNSATAYTPWGHRRLRGATAPADLPLPHA